MLGASGKATIGIKEVERVTNEEIQEIVAKADAEYDMLKDRVHDLYDENKVLKKEIERLTAESTKWESKFYDEAKKVDKAIEYIEKKYDYILGDDTFLDHDERIDRKQINHIIETLKGSDKE